MSRHDCRYICMQCTNALNYYVNYSQFHGFCNEHESFHSLGSCVFCLHCKALVYYLAKSQKLCNDCGSKNFSSYQCGCFGCSDCYSRYKICPFCNPIVIQNKEDRSISPIQVIQPIQLMEVLKSTNINLNYRLEIQEISIKTSFECGPAKPAKIPPFEKNKLGDYLSEASSESNSSSEDSDSNYFLGLFDLIFCCGFENVEKVLKSRPKIEDSSGDSSEESVSSSRGSESEDSEPNLFERIFCCGGNAEGVLKPKPKND